MARNDYTKAERDAWQAQRLAGERARRGAAPHMAGINALPRVNALPPTPAGTTDKFDTSLFTPAQRDKWLGIARKAGATKSNLTYAEAQKQQKAAQQKLQKEMSAATRGAFSSELKKGPTRDQINQAVKAGKTLRADVPSKCLASLTFELDEDGNGIATAEFFRGGAIVYDFPMDLDEFLEWASGSLGEYGNAYVFD
jgi:hypothetical protein